MLYKRNILIASAAVIIALGIWVFGSMPRRQASLPSPTPAITPQQENAAPPAIGTSTTDTATTTSTPAKLPATPKITIVGDANVAYNITVGKTPCGDHIGTVKIESSDPGRQLYWGLTGDKPLWLTFSEIEGHTPSQIDMTYNCILSGMENSIDWKFPVVEMTKDGKYVDGDATFFYLKGTITQ